MGYLGIANFRAIENLGAWWLSRLPLTADAVSEEGVALEKILNNHRGNFLEIRVNLVAGRNRCELVTFQGLGHSYNSSKFGTAGKAADLKTKADVTAFLTSLDLLAKPPGSHQ